MSGIIALLSGRDLHRKEGISLGATGAAVRPARATGVAADHVFQ